MADDIATQLEGAVESLGRFRDSLEDNNIRLGNASSIEAKINKLEADKLKLLDKANKMEGKRMKDLASGMGKAAKSMGSLAMKLGVVGGILTMFKGVVDVLLKVDRHAAKFSKQLGVSRKESKGLFDQAKGLEKSLQRVGINLGEVLKTTGALAQAFGQMDKVTDKMIEDTAKLAKAFGTSTEEAAKLTEQVTRAGGGTQDILKALTKARAAGVPLLVAYRDLAKNSGMVEMYTSRGSDALGGMLATSLKMGKSLDSFDKMANAWSDVEKIGENIGKTAQMFGGAFEEGLGNLTELYKMYENFQDEDLHKKITEQLAKTTYMEMENNKLVIKSYKTREALTRSQRKVAAGLYGDDEEFMMRSLKFQLEANAAGKKTTNEDFKALNTKKVTMEEITKILQDQEGVFTRIMNELAGILEPIKTAFSSIFDEEMMTHVTAAITKIGGQLNAIFSTGPNGAFNAKDIKDQISGKDGIGGALTMMGDRMATEFAKQFDFKTKEGKVINSWKGLMQAGWDTLISWLQSHEQMLGQTFGRIFQIAWDAVRLFDDPDTDMVGGMGQAYEDRNARALAISKMSGQVKQDYHALKGTNPELAEELLQASMAGTYNHAKGWAGGRHRGIVGEAGTEVGITRSALRELSSAGIPGYYKGFNAPGGTYQASGSYGARNQRGFDNQSVGNAYRQTQGRFLDGLWRNQYNFLEEQDKREASFFIKYPAIVDEAIGRPFRESGPLATGIYNSIFSGMQAGARAEFAGATAERQREIAWQHSVAEGLKEGGIINQGLDKLAAISTKILDNGIEVTRNDVASLGVLGGIQHGMHAMALSIGRGGSKGQALEMGKRGAIGGVIKGLTSSLGGQADPIFLENMKIMGYITGSTKMPSGSGRSTGDMLTAALNRTEATFQSQGRGLNWAGANAQGRVYNSPHLAMVGEGSQNEIIVPTERIRKGLPINAGVARELGSIGVPGYEVGKPSKVVLPKPDMSLVDVPKLGTHEGLVGWNMMHQGGAAFGGSRGAASISNIKGSAGNSLATAGLQFANTYMETGDAGRATGQAFGAGLGMAATAGLTPFLGPFAPLVGGMIGSFAGNALGNAFGYKPRHKKYRNRAMKLLESHARTGGRWDHGSPGGAQDAVMKALSGGKKKHPSEAAFEAMEGAVRGSSVLGGPVGRGGGVGPFLALLSGQVGDTGQENAMYARYNNAFTGNPLAMAKGGVVTRPTNAIIGEAGPEAVIPLNSMSDYSGIDQKKDNKNMIDELRKSNAQMQMFIKKIGDAKTVLNVDGRKLAETVGEGMWDINNGQ